MSLRHRVDDADDDSRVIVHHETSPREKATRCYMVQYGNEFFKPNLDADDDEGSDEDHEEKCVRARADHLTPDFILLQSEAREVLDWCEENRDKLPRYKGDVVPKIIAVDWEYRFRVEAAEETFEVLKARFEHSLHGEQRMLYDQLLEMKEVKTEKSTPVRRKPSTRRK